MGREYPLPWDVAPVEETAQQRLKKQRATIKQHKSKARRRQVLGCFSDAACFVPLRVTDIVLDPTM